MASVPQSVTSATGVACSCAAAARHRPHRADRRGTANGETRRHEQGLRARQPEQPAHPVGAGECREHDAHDREDREQPELADVDEAQLEAEQHDPGAHEGSRREAQAGRQRAIKPDANCRKLRHEDAQAHGCRQHRNGGQRGCSANATPTASAAATRPGMARTGTARNRMGAVGRGAGTGRDYPRRGSILVPTPFLTPSQGISVQTGCLHRCTGAGVPDFP